VLSYLGTGVNMPIISQLLSAQLILMVVSTLTPPKSGDVGELVGLGLHHSHDSHQVRTSLLMDITALRQR
jgi:hypothetical protein